MRASILVMGPLLARLDMLLLHCLVVVRGSRPIEQHIKGFEALGAEIHLENGNIYANAKDGLKRYINSFRFSSVGATQNIIMAASLAKGKTLVKMQLKNLKLSI